MVHPRDFVTASFSEALAAVRNAPPASAFYAVPSPQELYLIYSRGFQGIRPDLLSADDRQLIGEMRRESVRLYDVFPWAKGIGAGKIGAPFVACTHLIEGWGGLFAQVQGDCTVHGTEHAAEIDYCNDCLWGETKFVGPIAFENIYRSRGYNGDGWSCRAPAYYVGPAGKGGFLQRKVYEGPNGEKVDLTYYNSSWQSNGRAGVPKWLEEESRKNKAKWIIPIDSMDEYRDCLAMGFGINFCSGQGWESSTDNYGVSRTRGSWSHAMAHIGYNDTTWAHEKYGGMLCHIQNSWGKWNRINGNPEGYPKLPTGSFLTKASSVSRLFDGDQFAICSVWGWDRTNWEAFETIDRSTLIQHLTDSTVQDYYKHRQECMQEAVSQVLDQGFLTC